MLKRNLKNLSLILISIYMCLFFTGCWDYEDVEDRALVVSFGVDNPAPDKVRFDTEIAQFITNSPQQVTYEIKHFFGEGSNFDKARVNLQVQVKGPLSNGPATSIIISERFAKSDFFKVYLNRANRQYDLRKTVTMVISRKPASDLIGLSNEKNQSIGFFVENNITSLFPHSHIDLSIADVVTGSRIKDLGLLIPCIDLIEGKVHYIGLGVIKDFKLIDIINTWDSTGILFIMSPKSPLTLTISDPKSPTNVLTFSILTKNPKIKTRFENGKAYIDVSLSVKASLQFQYELAGKSEDDIKELENTLSKSIKEMIMESVEKSQINYKLDIFEFVKYFKADNPIAYRNLDWGKVYPEAKVNINVKATITDKNAMEYENKDKLDKR